MNCVTLRFYGDLNDFLPGDQKYKSFSHFFKGQPAVNDIVESLGVPHTEVDLLLINGKSSDFSQQLAGGESVAVYPIFESIDVSAVSQVRPIPLKEIRFTLDVHLGKLAAYLRMVGFDSHYSNSASQDQLVNDAATESRILLTFNQKLLMKKNVSYGYMVRSRDPNLQLVEVLTHFKLVDRLRPFEICMVCNGIVRPVPKEEVLSNLPKSVRESLAEFHKCPDCGRIYWKGTHYQHMNDFIQKIKGKIQMDERLRS